MPAQSTGAPPPLSESSTNPAVTPAKQPGIEVWATTCRIVAIVVVSTFVVFSIFTYYDRLSQYNTRDEETTLGRINLFLTNRSQRVLTDGSNLSNIVVGFPAKNVRTWLDKHFKEGDQLIGNIHYTKILPFAFVQVTIALLLLLGCVFLLGKLSDWQFSRDYFYHLLSFALVLNFPMLKGLCKILKYDCLSIILGMMAVLSYLIAKKRHDFYYFVLAIALSALAYIEKDTAISVLSFIALSEVILTHFEADSILRPCLRLLRSLLVLVVVFCLTLFAFVPKIWTDPGEMLVIFSPIPSYVGSAHPRLISVAAGVLLLLFFLKGYLLLTVRNIKPYISVKLAFLPLAALFLFALFYQKNDVKWAQSEAARSQIESRGLFVGRDIARVAMTTLDKSRLLTEAKLLLAEGRLVMYFLPELLVLTLIFCPLLSGKIRYAMDAKTTGLIVGFCLLNLFACAYLAMPIEAKYLASVMFTLTLLLTSFLAGITKQLSDKNSYAGSAASLVLVASLIVPAYQDAPAHFGYMNSFRSRRAEDIASIRVEDYSFWTWMGWGETSYELVKFASETSPGKNISVGYDYIPPLHYASNVKMVDVSEICRLHDVAGMDAYLRNLTAAGIDYIIISKNTANRVLLLNELLKEKRGKAVHVDRHGGIDYGWLFHPADLLSNSAQGGEHG